MRNQRTIKNSASVSGAGLHTGVKSRVTFLPAPENTGYVFVRTDLKDRPQIAADIDHVIDISRGTTIAQNGYQVHTVEHVLAALTGLGIDNAYIEVNNIEPPVCDGSAIEFVKALQKATIVEQNIPQQELVIDKIITYADHENGVDIHIVPAETFSITFLIDYKIPALGTQYSTTYSLEEEFIRDYAPARTFCFLSEIEELKEQNLIKGGDVDNAIVFVDKKIDQEEVNRIKNLFSVSSEVVLGNNGILNNIELRFYNEPVRHKVLDLIGDFALLGMPIVGHVIAARSGHSHNVKLVKKIRKEYEKTLIRKKYQDTAVADAFLDIAGIEKIMPHRYPFLLLDRIVDLNPQEKVTALKNVSINEHFFQGHFPGKRIMPGVLIVEALAQAGGFLLLNSEEQADKKLVFFSGIDKVRFRKPVVPGDQLRLEVEMVQHRLRMCKMHGVAYVDGKPVTEADMLASIVDK